MIGWTVLGLTATALALRLVPLRLAGPSWGGDRWYWRAFVDELRQTWRLPPALPQYVLDAGHWYPPVFPLLMAALPEAWLARRDPFLAVALDLARFGLVLAVAGRLGSGDALGLAVAGLAYATAPILISYNSQLNPRGLGALFLDGAVLTALWWWRDGSGWALLGSVWLGAAVLLTHKMTTQLWCFLCVTGALALRDPRVALLVPGSMLAAWLLSGGYYRKVLLAHWDIVRFWHRNWRWLFCHPLRDSPLYRPDSSREIVGLHGGGWRGALRRCVGLAGMGPAAWAAAAAGWPLLLGGARSRDLDVLVGWLSLVLAFALVTTFVAPLRGLGAGYLYLYNAASPAALAWGALASSAPTASLTAAWLLALVAALVAVALFFRRLSRLAGAAEESTVAALAEHLRGEPRGRVLCVPQGVSDALAYQTGQPVVWGGHGYGFRNLQPLFPRWLIPLNEALVRYEVRYLVVEGEGDLPEAFERELERLPPPRRFGRYRLFAVGSGAGLEPAA